MLEKGGAESRRDEEMLAVKNGKSGKSEEDQDP